MRFWSSPRDSRARSRLFRVHLYAALAAGLLLAVLGLSGALLVYAPELETGALPARGRVKGPVPEIVAAGLLAERPGMRLRDVRFDRHGNPVVLNLQEGKLGRGGRVLYVLVDPATGEALREADRGAGVWHWLRELHHDLFAGRAGRQVNGVGAVLLLLLSLTGLAVWWPGPRLGRRQLGVARGAGWKRTVWDLHHSAGFWICAGLAFFAFTGILFAWPEAVRGVFGVRPGPRMEWKLAASAGAPAAMAGLARG